VVDKFDKAILFIDRALNLEVLQERSRIIFGALTAQLFFLAGVVSLQEYPDQILRWDNKLREALQSLLPNFIISEDTWTLASLPTELGGLGIRRLGLHADAHFLSAHLACTALARSHVPKIAPFFGNPLVAPTSEPDALVARAYHRLVAVSDRISDLVDFEHPSSAVSLCNSLSACVHDVALKRLRLRLVPEQRAWLLSQAADLLWFGTIPTELSLSISNSDFTYSLVESLLIPFYNLENEQNLRCQHCDAVVDRNGQHYLLCTAAGNPGRTAISDRLRDEWATMLRSLLYLNVKVEPRTGLSNQKRGDVACRSKDSSGSDFFDIVTVAPYRKSQVTVSSCVAGASAKAAEKAKIAHHITEVTAEGNTFYPIAWELGGRLGDVARDYITKATRSVSSSPRVAKALEFYWRKRLSVAGRCAVARCLREQHEASLNLQRTYNLNDHAAHMVISDSIADLRSCPSSPLSNAGPTYL
jgi:hypothetical protein